MVGIIAPKPQDESMSPTNAIRKCDVAIDWLFGAATCSFTVSFDHVSGC